MEGAIKRALHQTESQERKRQHKLSKGLSSTAPTPPATGQATPSETRRGSLAATEKAKMVDVDMERNQVVVRSRWSPWNRTSKKENVGGDEFKPTLRDVNPFPTMWSIWKKPANFVILIASGESSDLIRDNRLILT
jgi:hypothetical protein